MGDAGPLWAVHLTVLGRIWTSGGELDWTIAGCPAPQRRAALPGYPYQRARHWIPPHQPAVPGDMAAKAPDAMPEVWYPVWRDTGPPPAPSPAPGTVLLVTGPDTAAARTPLLALRQLGYDVVRFTAAPHFAESDGHFTGTPGDLHRAAALLRASGRTVTVVVDAQGFGAVPDQHPLAGPALDGLPSRLVLTSRGADVSGCDTVGPAAALARQVLAADSGACWLDAPAPTTPERLAVALHAILASGSGSALAVRGTRLWIPAPMPLPAGEPAGGAAAGLLGHGAGSVLVVDGPGTMALDLGDTLASAGVAAELRVITSADTPVTDALLAVEELGPAVDVSRWDGEPGTLAAAVARSAGNARLAAVVVAAAAADANSLVRAAAEGLCGAVPAVAAVVCQATGVRAPLAAASSGAIDVAHLGAERAVILLTAAPRGPVLLGLLTQPTPELVVSGG